jgi:hypothetical protein
MGQGLQVVPLTIDDPRGQAAQKKAKCRDVHGKVSHPGIRRGAQLILNIINTITACRHCGLYRHILHKSEAVG